MRFVKMEGAGNDYVYVDCIEQPVPNRPDQLAIEISKPHFGVGADGLILILPSDVADGKMRIFNGDGSEALMCGNGVRCVAKYLYDAGYVKGESLTVETAAGIREIDLVLKGGACVGAKVMMGAPGFSAESLSARFQESEWIRRPVSVCGTEYAVTCVSMGNPHAVILVAELPDDEEFVRAGRAIENHPMFMDRANVEFVKVVSKDRLKVRVWERGSGETLACGTGACASLVAAVRAGLAQPDAEVQLKGGTLRVEWDGYVYMTGPAREVFRGEWVIENHI